MPAAHDPDTDRPVAPAASAEATARRALTELERRLEGMAQAGVRHLNVAPPPPGATKAATKAATRAATVVPAQAARPQAPRAAEALESSPMPPARPQPTPARNRPAPQSAPPLQAPPQVPAADGPPPAAPASAPPDPATLATLESLRFQYRDCRACGLCETRTRLVFGVGSDRPRLMFIGEGPGADEDAQGLPFVGRAGRLLTGFIQAMGLVREDVYITNVVKCRPPGNRNPEPPEVAACRPILQRQIELLDPRLIVTLGNVPLKTLNPKAGGITRERGRRFTYGRWAVLPTFHPSYLLRSPGAIPDCWADLRQALEWAYADHPGAAEP